MKLNRSTVSHPASRHFFDLGLLSVTLFVAMLQSNVQADEPAIRPITAQVAANGAAAVPIEHLLPAKTVLLLLDEGLDAHQAGWDGTAASDSLSKTGVFQMGQRLVESYLESAKSDELTKAETKALTDTYISAAQSLSTKGYAVAVSLPEGAGIQWPRLTVILPHGGSFLKTINQLLVKSVVTASASSPPKGVAPESAPCLAEGDEPGATNATPAAPDKQTVAVAADAMQWKPVRIGTREIISGTWESNGKKSSNFDIAIWSERGHLVFVLGPDATQQALDLADGKVPNITTHRIWQELHSGELRFERRSFGWVDVQGLRGVYDDVPLGDIGTEGSLEAILEGIGELVDVLPDLLMTPFNMLFFAMEAQPAPAAPAVPVVNVPPNDVPQNAVPPIGVQQAEKKEVGETVKGAKVAVVPADVKPLDSKGVPATGDRVAANEVQKPAELENGKSETQQPQANVPVEIEKKSLLTIRKLLTVLGLDNVQHYSWQSGYHGRALWSETYLYAPGAKQGLLAVLDQPAMKLEQLPPLPVDTSAFHATSIDLQRMGQAYGQICANFAPLLSPTTVSEIETSFQSWRAENGALFDNLIGGLDSVVCFYNDAANGPFSFGPVMVWKVKDANRVRRALNKVQSILASQSVMTTTTIEVQEPARDEAGEAEEVPEPKPDNVKFIAKEETYVKVTRKIRFGRDVVGIQARELPFGIAYVVDDNWLAVSLNSQLLDAFLLRIDGKLPRWEPTAIHREALSRMPEQFTSISIEDPRKTLTDVVSLSYCGVAWLDTFCHAQNAPPEMENMWRDVMNLPPAELIIQPLFPNVTVTAVEAAGVRTYSRTSLPALSWWNYAVGYSFVGVFGGFDLLDF